MLIITVRQGNSFYDPRRVNNGGGYDQPHIYFSHDGVEGYLFDSSCGDFGTRIDFGYGDKAISWGSMYGYTENWPKEWSRDFYEVARETLGYWLPEPGVDYTEEDDYDDYDDPDDWRTSL